MNDIDSIFLRMKCLFVFFFLFGFQVYKFKKLSNVKIAVIFL